MNASKTLLVFFFFSDIDRALKKAYKLGVHFGHSLPVTGIPLLSWIVRVKVILVSI